MERIEGLEQRAREIRSGFRTNWAQASPKQLEAEQRAFLADLARPLPGQDDNRPDSRELLDAMLAFGAQLGKGVS